MNSQSRSAIGLTLLMTLVLLLFAAQKQSTLILGACVCAVYALSKAWPVRIAQEDFFVFLLACLLFTPGFIKPYHGISPVFYFFASVATYFAAKYSSNHSPVAFLAAFRSIYATAIFAISAILYSFWGHPEPFGEVIEGSSTNGIPSYLIVIQIGLSLSNYLLYKRLPIISPLLTGVVAFFGNGRGSLVVAGLIIAASLFINAVLASQKSNKVLFKYVLLLTALLLPVILNFEELADLLFSYTKLSVGLDDENRIGILSAYLGKINFFTALFGADYSNTVIEYKMLGNPHIAYIRTHSFYGLPLTLMALLSPVFVFFSNKTKTDKCVFSLFISFAALRATSEPIFFPTLLDFFYFINFFLFYRYASDRNLAPARERV